jgi:hypothetical protein
MRRASETLHPPRASDQHGKGMNITKMGPIEKLTRSDAEAPEYTRHLWYVVENGRLVATNGHALVIAAVEPGSEDVTGVLTVEAIQYARLLSRKSSSMASFDCGASEFRFNDGTRMRRLMPHSAFPDYAAIVPKISGPPMLTFNPELLAQIVAAFPKQELGKKGMSPGSISLWVVPSEDPTEASPIFVRAHYDGGIAVLMPVAGMDPERWTAALPSGVKK